MSTQLPKAFWIIFAVFCCFLVLLSLAMVFGKLSPQSFAVLAVLLMIFPFLRYWKLFQVAAKDQPRLEASQAIPVLLDQMKSTIRSSRIRIMAISALACFGIWETRGGPLAPRLIGLGFLLLLLTGNILSLRQAERALEQFNSGE
ncbi:MAG TPA: hypothetical protein VK596_07405 [Edaphobacter sp.]|nr:hypothetical protein [Edaphobacter sp.]